MKKLVVAAAILLVIILGIIMMINMKQEVGISTVKTLTSVESFGNQMNRQLWTTHNYALDGDWLYGLEGGNHLAKRQLANNSEPETIFSTTGDWMPSNVSAYDGWIYFSIGDYRAGGDVDLYRIREDGSGKRKLLNGGDDSNNYVLAKEGIVYMKDSSIYIMNLDGSDKRKIPIKYEEEEGMGIASNMGIDNGWIYYFGYKDIYRMKPDGSKTEKVYTASIYEYVMDNNELYFVQNDNGNINTKYLVKKKINGKETVLATGSSSDFLCFNIEGDWIYFQEGNKVYKMKKTGEEAKQLVYKGKNAEQIRNIFLHDGDALISSDMKELCIKKDGEVIDLD